MEESYSECHHKPHSESEMNSNRILPRKNSEHILKTIQNNICSTSNNQNEINIQMKTNNKMN